MVRLRRAALPAGLTGPEGIRISPAAVDLRQVRCWAVRTDYSATDTYKIVPEILDPVAPTDLDRGTCRRYWFTVHVPDDAKPGLYTGTVTVWDRECGTADWYW